LSQITVNILEYDAQDHPALVERARGIVPPEAMTRGGKAPLRQTAFFAGRAALAWGLEKLGWRGVIRADKEFGYLVAEPASGMPALFVNISHTELIAVAVIATSPVGIDVEKISRDASRVITRVSSPVEIARLSSWKIFVDGKHIPSPLLLWSGKEAVSKALGLGITFGMHCFEIDLQSETGLYDVRVSGSGPLKLENPALKYFLHQEYLVSVCTEKERLGSGLLCRLVP